MILFSLFFLCRFAAQNSGELCFLGVVDGSLS